MRTEAEGDLAAVAVDVEHDGFDFIADGEHVARLADALGPAHFGDVDQAFDAGFDFDERAVRHDVDHLAVDLAALRILGDHVVPRVAGLLLEAERNALFFLVDADDDDFEVLADRKNFGRMGDAAPGNIGDVEQPVNAAEVDERAEVGDVLDHALAELVDLHLAQQLDAVVAERLLKQFAARNDDVAAVLVDLDDFDIELFADVVVHIVHRAHVELGAGQEGREAFDIDHDAALDAVAHETLDNIAFAVLGGDAVPGLDRVGFFETEFRHVVAVFDLFEEDVDFVADGDRVELEELIGRNEPLGLVADIDKRAVLTFRDDDSFHDLALGEGAGAFGGRQKLFHRVRDVREVQEAVREFVFFCHVVLCSCFLLVTG